jgi:hypothetical protein
MERGAAKVRKAEVGQRAMPPFATPAQPCSMLSPQGLSDGRR